jgi:hypothetical protein
VIWIVDAHGYEKRFVVHADELLTAFFQTYENDKTEPKSYETPTVIGLLWWVSAQAIKVH